MLILGGGAPLEKEWRGHLQEVKVFLPVWAYTRLLELGFISVAAATQCTPLSGASPWGFIRVCCGVVILVDLVAIFSPSFGESFKG